MEEYNKLFGTRAEPLFEAVDHPSANEGASELYGAWKQKKSPWGRKSLSRIMESETNQATRIECGTMINLLNSGLKDKNPEELSKILWETNQTKP